MFEYAKEKQSKSTNMKKTASRRNGAVPNLTGIPDSIKTKYEDMSGLSFDDVRVHYKSDKPVQMKALAYTQGNQVYIAPGQEEHLEHELGHVVQQKQGRVQPTEHLGDIPINTNSQLEQEADRGLFNEDTGIKEGVQVVQRQEGLPEGCPVYVGCPGIHKIGKIIKRYKDSDSPKARDVYDVEIDHEVLHGISAIYVQALGQIMTPSDFYDNDSQENDLSRITITSKESMPTLSTPSIDLNVLDKAPYGKNHAIDETGVFHLGSNSGTLLIKTQDGYRVVFLERCNKELPYDERKNQFAETNIKGDFSVDQIITTGLTGCSFIAMTDEEHSFLAVAHLDVGDDIPNVVHEMQERELKPTRMYASIIDGKREGREVSRIRELKRIFQIDEIYILNRGNSDMSSSYALNVVGIDLGTGRAPLEAGNVHASAVGERPMSFFGEMGSSREVIKRYLKGWLIGWIKDCAPKSWFGGADPEPIKASLETIGIAWHLSNIVIDKLGELGGNGNFYKGIEKCLKDEKVCDELIDIMELLMGRKAFSKPI